MSTSDDDLATLERDLLRELESADDLTALETFRVSALGKKGRVSDLMKTLGKLPAEERRAFGQSVNGLKQRVSEALDTRKATLGRAEMDARLAHEIADITLPVRPGPEAFGRIHPISQVWDELTEIFADMGFSVAEGPDIETEEKNFDKLNIPASHPARQEMDTFYLRGSEPSVAREEGTRKVLRTHTSPVQVRTMEAQDPPIRIIAPGRVYRSDSDQTHTPMFHQVEGLVIDESTHMGHLKWCLEERLAELFQHP
ncbi:MAG: phenylalanine--tRNA ligase subunit alpha, partial [Pseudomonadota bacterium]